MEEIVDITMDSPEGKISAMQICRDAMSQASWHVLTLLLQLQLPLGQKTPCLTQGQNTNLAADCQMQNCVPFGGRQDPTLFRLRLKALRSQFGGTE